jgi:hypothetical protein
MRKSAAVLAAVLGSSACASEPEGVAERVGTSAEARAVVVDEMAPETWDVCDLLPDDCGACSVACDWEALREYVPPGTCAAFVCDLVDGTQAIFHACHPD